MQQTGKSIISFSYCFEFSLENIEHAKKKDLISKTAGQINLNLRNGKNQVMRNMWIFFPENIVWEKKFLKIKETKVA